MEGILIAEWHVLSVLFASTVETCVGFPGDYPAECPPACHCAAAAFRRTDVQIV